jgi:phosphoribosyl 1,2-cyclic phosphodiesterase
VILDSHFTPDEMSHHKGWGHGDWAQCARFAARCGVARLWLFHHKPGRTDDEMRQIEGAAREVFKETNAAKEGVGFTV